MQQLRDSNLPQRVSEEVVVVCGGVGVAASSQPGNTDTFLGVIHPWLSCWRWGGSGIAPPPARARTHERTQVLLVLL